MKLKVICDKKDIGSIEVSTYPGISHSFELNKKHYKILKVEETQIDVLEFIPERLVKPEPPGDEKK